MANEFIARKGLIALEASQITGSLNVSGGITGSLQGTSSWASNALTSSFVNTLNQNLIITGAVSIGTSSIGPSENTLTLGARDTANEGGQLGLNAPGGTYTSASFIDLYQNRFRILRGTNAGSIGEVVSWNLGTLQMSLPAYTNASSFVGTATANLAVDSGGNVITVSTAGGTVFPYTGNAVITGSLTVTQPIYVPINGNMYLQGGDDAALYDINVVNTMGIYGVQDVTVGAVKLGSNGPVLYGSSSKLGIGTTNPSSASLTINGNVWANSFTGSLNGTASWAINALTASFVNNLNQNLSITGSVILSGSGLPELRVIGDTQFTGSVSSLNGYTGSLFGTSSWSTNAISSSLAVQNLVTASVSLNTITFTKGDGTTFPIVVNTGSGGGGGGGVTINNNVDDYIVTATGTSNTLNGESTLTFDGTTLTLGGNAVMTAIDVRNDPVTSAGEYAPGSHMARDWPAAGGPSLIAGNIVYFSGSSQWANAEADITGSSIGVLGVVTSNADPNEILLQGTITINTDLATYRVGQPVYLSPLVPGAVTRVPPSSSGHVARYVGWVVDTSRDQIYFNPDFTYIQL
jgi:hypothetical protein